ncbi:hypothetical protein [Deinococcus marmoris]|uniref:hypothetical protein n=1 Tax=Deinococcus marmoris TaxID=249408 RepID=UPI000A89A6C5
MNELELHLLRHLRLPEEPELLRVARAYGPRTWWPGRYRRRARRLFVGTLRLLRGAADDWVCHELHLRGTLDARAELTRWLGARVRRDMAAHHNACAVSVQRSGRRLVAVVVLATLRPAAL